MRTYITNLRNCPKLGLLLLSPLHMQTNLIVRCLAPDGTAHNVIFILNNVALVVVQEGGGGGLTASFPFTFVFWSVVLSLHLCVFVCVCMCAHKTLPALGHLFLQDVWKLMTAIFSFTYGIRQDKRK